MGKCSEELPARHKEERGIIAGVFWRMCTPKRSLGVKKTRGKRSLGIKKTRQAKLGNKENKASEAWEPDQQ
jgi:hypothetical protein